MRSLLIIGGGLVLLGISVLVGRWIAGPPTMAVAAKFFIAVWLLVALYNMWAGIVRGYTLAEEFPIFLVIFLIPAVVAAFIVWKFS